MDKIEEKLCTSKICLRRSKKSWYSYHSLTKLTFFSQQSQPPSSLKSQYKQIDLSLMSVHTSFQLVSHSILYDFLFYSIFILFEMASYFMVGREFCLFLVLLFKVPSIVHGTQEFSKYLWKLLSRFP